jgi:hypothetical protein
MNLIVRDGKMLDHARDDDKFAGANDGLMVAKLHAQDAFDDQEELIFVLMMMPEELALEFDDLNIAIVDPANDVRFVMFGEERELLLQIDGFWFHGGS